MTGVTVTDSRLRAPLRRLPFRRLGLSYAVNELGDWMGSIALSVLVFEQTGSALAMAAFFLGTRFVPAVLAPLLLERGIRPPPRYALPVIYCGEAAAFGGLALLTPHFSLAAVIIVAMLDGALALTGRTLIRAVVAELLEPVGELRAGNAVLNLAFTGGAMVGPLVAGLLVAAIGVQSALLVNGIAFYAIAWILLTVGPLPQVKPAPERIRGRVGAGAAYIRRRVTLRRLFVAQSAAFVFFAAVIPIEVIYAKETLEAGNAGYGLLLGSWGAGMVVGSLIFAAARTARLTILLFFSTVAVGVGYLGMGVAPTLATACVASVLGGAGNGIQWIGVVSAVQELTTSRMQARTLSVLEAAAAAMPGVGFVLGGVIAASIDPRATFLFAGAGVLLVTAIAVPVMRRDRSPAQALVPAASGLETAGFAPSARVPQIDPPSRDEMPALGELEVAVFFFLLGTSITVGTVAWQATDSVTTALGWALGSTLAVAVFLAIVFKSKTLNRTIAAAMRWIVGR